VGGPIEAAHLTSDLLQAKLAGATGVEALDRFQRIAAALGANGIEAALQLAFVDAAGALGAIEIVALVAFPLGDAVRASGVPFLRADVVAVHFAIAAGHGDSSDRRRGGRGLDRATTHGTGRVPFASALFLSALFGASFFGAALVVALFGASFLGPSFVPSLLGVSLLGGGGLGIGTRGRSARCTTLVGVIATHHRCYGEKADRQGAPPPAKSDRAYSIQSYVHRYLLRFPHWPFICNCEAGAVSREDAGARDL